MTDDILRKAIQLRAEIEDTSSFLHSCKCNYHIRFFKKKFGLAVTVSDYMRETRLFELNSSQREKFIKMLEQELAEKEKELEQLN